MSGGRGSFCYSAFSSTSLADGCQTRAQRRFRDYSGVVSGAQERWRWKIMRLLSLLVALMHSREHPGIQRDEKRGDLGERTGRRAHFLREGMEFSGAVQ
jgi:hypothetical protein